MNTQLTCIKGISTPVMFLLPNDVIEIKSINENNEKQLEAEIEVIESQFFINIETTLNGKEIAEHFKYHLK